MLVLKNSEIDSLNHLRNQIDIRIRIEKSNIQNVKYVDFQKNLDKIKSETNYVIFGRRGSGKTSLLLKLYQNYRGKNSIPIYIECELCKEYTYPNVLIYVLLEIFEGISKSFGPLDFISSEKKEIKKIIDELKSLFHQPDIREVTQESDESATINAEISGSIPESLSSKVGSRKSFTKSQKYTDIVEKINLLQKKLPHYKSVLENALKKKNNSVGFILLDDYYFIKKPEQALVIDYVHRLCKNTKFFFKMATVRHRSILYQKDDEGIRGIQEGMDFQSIDLDYSLAEIKKTESFMDSILNDLESQVGSRKVHDLLVTGNGGFSRLVWASGGVPRDFLILLKYCIDSIISGQATKIGKREIDLAAHKYYLDKQAEFGTAYYKDGAARSLLENLKMWCLDYQERTGFLVRNFDYEKNPVFNDLIDLRLIHLAVKSTTSKSKSGEIFDGYILDVGCYSNRLTLRTGLKEIDILRNFEKKGETEFRSIAPILDWSELTSVESILKVKNDAKARAERIPIDPGQTKILE